jgi:hypothetical protein
MLGGVSSVDQTRTQVNLPWPSGKTERVSVARGAEELWQGGTGHSYLELAGLPRNLYQ